MELKPEQFLRELSQKKLRPIYYLSGEEKWLKELALEKLKQILGRTGFDSQTWEGNSLQIKDFVSSAGTPSLFSKFRLLIIKHAEFLNAASRSALAEYLQKPIENSCLLIQTEERKPAKGDPLAAQAATQGAVIIYWPLSESEAAAWAEKFLEESHAKATPEAIKALIQTVGTSLSIIYQELSKILLYTQGQKEPIREEQILACLGYQAEQNIFDLGKDLQAKDFFKALQRLQEHLEHGLEPLMLLRHITSALEKVLKAKRWMAKGAQEDQIFREAGVNRFFNKNFIQWVQQWKGEEIQRALTACLEMEGRLKSNANISPRVELELLLGGWGQELGRLLGQA
ncbi:MAG: DNA polymerase III subunit delta [Elusimicrobia bacterium]|nr:DNA polymerase III subunit delta [Elusimicrobiota bacterium]